MIGRRVAWGDRPTLQPGDYAKGPPDERWYACTPNGHLGDLSLHDVVEHEDGTITVAPSILVQSGDVELWHGYLERGVWRSV